MDRGLHQACVKYSCLNKARKRLPQSRTVVNVTRSCFSPRVGGRRSNAGPAEFHRRRFRKVLGPGGVYSAAQEAYCGLEADKLPYADSQHVMKRAHRDGSTRSDLAASPKWGQGARTGVLVASVPTSGLHVHKSNLHTNNHRKPHATDGEFRIRECGRRTMMNWD
jgi:hypothetical protein